ncbi:MaoC/PaaZ C-terminal domain-containing protein [Streptomyces sp. NPDC102451]|uniref:MaoC/PaaZ C-terminal domain-containing protein n=1 Tax=Streptomyces sp. NPDC102451 TaxID=3366177 RepID=UPI0037F819D6
MNTIVAPTVGDTAQRTFGPLTLTDIVRYAGASGDFNPLHHDEEAAKAAGFAGIFSIGMFTAALVGTFATDWLGAESIRRITTRFKEQVWPGDTLTVSGTVTAVRPADGGSTVEVELACTRDRGGAAVAGSAEFFIRTV